MNSMLKQQLDELENCQLVTCQLLASLSMAFLHKTPACSLLLAQQLKIQVVHNFILQQKGYHTGKIVQQSPFEQRNGQHWEWTSLQNICICALGWLGVLEAGDSLRWHTKGQGMVTAAKLGVTVKIGAFQIQLGNYPPLKILVCFSWSLYPNGARCKSRFPQDLRQWQSL